jgi:ribosomal protein L32
MISECKSCGSKELEAGKLRAGLGFVVRFTSSKSLFSRPEPVAAVVCQKCGRLELALILTRRH